MGVKLYQEVNTITNLETGEVKSIEHHIRKRVDINEFIQVYLEDMGGLLKIKNGTEFKLMALIWKASEMRRHEVANRVVITKAIKDEWSEELKVKSQSINNALTQLVKKELLVKKDRTIYYLNPKYFFKGALADRPHAIKIVLEYLHTDTPLQNELFDNEKEV
jgi:hypothetical protein